MLLSAVSILIVAQSSSEIPEGLKNNPEHIWRKVECLATYKIDSRESYTFLATSNSQLIANSIT